jgi:hypothetical protein
MEEKRGGENQAGLSEPRRAECSFIYKLAMEKRFGHPTTYH